MKLSDKKVKLVLLIQLLIFISSISVSAAEWRGQEYTSYYYPPSDDIIDDVKQKIMEKYNLPEEYFDEHLILSSADVYCYNPTEWEWNYSTFCLSKKENPHLLQSIQVGWVFVPEKEEYKDTDFFINARFFVGVTIYDKEGLGQAVKDMEQNTGFDMSRIVIDYKKNVIYSFPLLNDILKVVGPGDVLISKEEAEEKLLRCVGSFSPRPYIGSKRGIIYMGASGPTDSEGKTKVARVDLKTGEIVECGLVGPGQPEPLRGLVEDDNEGNLDKQQPLPEENIIKKFLNWLSKLFKKN